MYTTLVILAICVIFFIHGKISADFVALCALIALVIFDIITPSEAIASFADPIVIMMIGLFIVSGGILRTGLAKMLSSRILQLAGSSENKLYFLIMLATTSIGAFVSNTGTVALMLPIILSMAMDSKINARRLLMPLAFAGSLGGMFTLIGTPPNMVVAKTLSDAGYNDLKFFSFAPTGFIVFAIGLIMLYFLSETILTKSKDDAGNKSRSKSLRELVQEYQIANKTFYARIDHASNITIAALQELHLTEKYMISIAEVIKPTKRQFLVADNHASELAGPRTKLNLGDTIGILGLQENVQKFINDNNLTALPNVKQTQQNDLGIAEALIMPTSKLIKIKISDSKFREKYNINVLAVNHGGMYITDGIKDEIMRSGDALLLQGSWANLAHLAEDHKNIVLVGEPLTEASKITLNHKAPIAALIMIAMIVAMVTNIVAPVIAVLCAAIVMVLTGCLRNMAEGYNTISWGSIVLVAAMLPMSVALQKTGTSTVIATKLIDTLGNMGPFVLLAGIYAATSFLTLFISNTATAVLFAPIALQVAQDSAISPYPFLMAVTIAASMCFASPFSTPSNVMVMSAGRYTFMDYVKVGLPLQILIGVVIILVLPLIFPFGS